MSWASEPGSTAPPTSGTHSSTPSWVRTGKVSPNWFPWKARWGSPITIAGGRDYREVLQHFRPGFDLEAERQARIDAGLGEYLNANDLYPDVRPCLTQLRERGYFVGIAGNQTARAGRFIRELNLPAHIVATSDDWGVSKPSVEFFEKLIAVSRHESDEILYVGDRLDNDISPAGKAGLMTALVQRGPWGFVLDRSLAQSIMGFDVAPTVVIGSLSRLSDRLVAPKNLRPHLRA